MAFDYPVSLDVTGRRCLVVGGGALAEERARALLGAGAEVTVIAVGLTPGLGALAAAGSLTHVARPYRTGDLAGVFLAVATGTGPALNSQIHAEAEAAGVLLNAVDDKPHCHFALPAVLRRGPLAVTVSTGGRSPALARRIREDLDRHIGPEYGTLVELVAEVRDELQSIRRAGTGGVPTDFATWSERWTAALAGDLPGLVRTGHSDHVRALLRQALTEPREEAVA